MFGSRSKLKYKAVESNHVDEVVDFEPIKRKTVSPACLWSTLFTSLLICIYYIPSIGLTFYQHWLFENFHYPLITVLVHMIVKFMLACVIRAFLERRQERKRVTLGWREYIVAVAPPGLSSGIDIGFSNWGLELVTISLYTMTKSTVIIFILIFSILFKLERKSWSLSTIVLMISLGLTLFTYKSTQFSFPGFTLLILASVAAGIRWTCVQMILQKSRMGMQNPIDMIYHMQPWMLLSVLPFAIWIEGSVFIKNCRLFRFTDSSVPFFLGLKILFGAFIAFFLEVTEVVLISYTSSLTLSIAGIFKELFMIVLAVLCNGDQLSFINVIGLLLCLCGIISHVAHKIKVTAKKANERLYEHDNERHELGEYLIDENIQMDESTDTDEGEKSDTQVLFDILNRHDP